MFKKIFTIGVFILCLFWIAQYEGDEVRAITSVSDLLTRTWPGASSSHTVIFRVTADIPPAGKIVLTPEPGQFFIPAGFDHTDVDLATSSARNGVYTDRSLAASADGVSDGVSVASSSANGSVTITLNSSYGIRSGTYVHIELGGLADYGEAGDMDIYNPTNIDSYYIEIRTLTPAGVLIKKARAMMAILEPVSITGNYGKVRSFGAPVGYLSYGTTQTVLSLVTNYDAYCRYSQTASTTYDDMTHDFAYTTGRSPFHSVLVGGLSQTSENTFYVRCEDEAGYSDDPTECIYTLGGNSTTTIATTCVDYLISFHVTTIEDAVGDESGQPGPGGGGSGGGGGGGIGNDRGRGTGDLLPYPPLPGNPGVAFTGWAYPNSQVVVMRDGNDVGAINARSNAGFGTFLPDLSQGVYTFGLWSEDSNGLRSETYSTTFWIDEGTQTIVSDIFLPPTIKASRTQLDIGNRLELSGQSVPGSTVEVWLYPGQANEIKESNAIKGQSLADNYGNWTVSLPTGSAAVSGNYSASARSTIDEDTRSDWGRSVSLTLGGEPIEEETGACEGADLNQDGRVNITDFSILLYYWNTDNDCADQNNSGKVDLIDFSIMLYYWTG